MTQGGMKYPLLQMLLLGCVAAAVNVFSPVGRESANERRPRRNATSTTCLAALSVCKKRVEQTSRLLRPGLGLIPRIDSTFEWKKSEPTGVACTRYINPGKIHYAASMHEQNSEIKHQKELWFSPIFLFSRTACGRNKERVTETFLLYANVPGCPSNLLPPS